MARTFTTSNDARIAEAAAYLLGRADAVLVTHLRHPQVVHRFAAIRADLPASAKESRHWSYFWAEYLYLRWGRRTEELSQHLVAMEQLETEAEQHFEGPAFIMRNIRRRVLTERRNAIGDGADAIHLYEAEVRRAEEEHGPTHHVTHLARLRLSDQLRGIGGTANLARARELAEMEFKQRRDDPDFGQEHPFTLDARASLGLVLLAQGIEMHDDELIRTARADQIRIRDLRQDILGPAHYSTRLSHRHVARCELALGNWLRAHFALVVPRQLEPFRTVERGDVPSGGVVLGRVVHGASHRAMVSENRQKLLTEGTAARVGDN